MTFEAYHGRQSEKDAILAQLAAHRKADELIKGEYWKDGKGCAVGCTIHSGDHMEYEPRFGIPVMIALLEDVIFEGLPNGNAKKWPERVMSAIEPGADLSHVGWQLLHCILTDPEINPGINHELVRGAVRRCADVIAPLTCGESVNANAARSAESAARSAWNAAEIAESAAWSAEIAANAAIAAWSAESAANAANAARNAESAAWVKIADKLIELIKAAPLAQ